MIPNHLPHISRAEVQEITNSVSRAIMRSVKKRLEMHGNVQVVHAFGRNENICYKVFDGLMVMVAARGDAGATEYFPSGRYHAQAKQIDLEVRENVKLAVLAKPGKWQEDLYSTLAHELTHSRDPIYKARLPRSSEPLDAKEYYRQIQERKAFTREIAEYVAKKILVYQGKPKSSWKRFGKTASMWLARAINETSGPSVGLMLSLTDKESERVYRDVVQFLEGEGLLAIVEAAYA